MSGSFPLKSGAESVIPSNPLSPVSVLFCPLQSQPATLQLHLEAGPLSAVSAGEEALIWHDI